MRPLPSRRSRGRGLAAVEFALLLPVLLVLMIGLVDVARALQAQMILVNLSREAANLSSRGKLQLSENAQTIIGQVAASAPPLDMNKLGMIYVTRIMGSTSGGTTRSIVLEQYRWDDPSNNRGYRASGYAPLSKVWTCSNWASGTAGTCLVPTGSTAPVVSMMSGQLLDGEVIYVVEAYYKFNMLFQTFSFGSFSTPTLASDFYSMTVF
ncbi:MULTISPECIES: TadE/TadG family type IV pilus assembly protein [unclassified Duganella]|uniref:TadE/TadG family type IV pilus assembly protein n=1 Tax=unclassified Duganella TaxID=2636909 RepID=UPI00088366CB|nr:MULTISPECIES: TadE family protein [unclassified Duganella]SDF94314.1 Flp pilus assembly protein TadG [Duganella sp. OV458]SDJ10442.1 Flp pilus assembly protein TadG [Duganella sp. OV510]